VLLTNLMHSVGRHWGEDADKKRWKKAKTEKDLRNIKPNGGPRTGEGEKKSALKSAGLNMTERGKTKKKKHFFLTRGNRKKKGGSEGKNPGKGTLNMMSYPSDSTTRTENLLRRLATKMKKKKGKKGRQRGGKNSFLLGHLVLLRTLGVYSRKAVAEKKGGRKQPGKAKGGMISNSFCIRSFVEKKINK